MDLIEALSEEMEMAAGELAKWLPEEEGGDQGDIGAGEGGDG